MPKWQPNTAYVAGDRVVNPSGDVVLAKTAFTSGATYDPANWNLPGTYEARTRARSESLRPPVAPNRVGLPPYIASTNLYTGTSAITPAGVLFAGATVCAPGGPVRFSGCRAADMATPFNNNTGYVGRAGQFSAVDSSQPFMVDFMVDSADFEVLLGCNNSKSFVQVWIDGKLIAEPVTVGTVGTNYKYRITPSGGRRVMHVRMRVKGASINGLVMQATDSIWRPKFPLYRLRAYVLGDSYTAGAQETLGRTFACDIGDALGWDIVHGGQSGTGYKKPGTGGTATFESRATTDAIPEAPDAVIILGSLNDSDYVAAASATAAEVGAAATATYTALRNALPNVPVFVFGPQWPKLITDTVKDSVETQIRTAAQAASNVKLWASIKGWITGTGQVGTTNGSGNSDIYTEADGVHPSNAGHRFYGSRMAQEIAAAYPAA